MEYSVEILLFFNFLVYIPIRAASPGSVLNDVLFSNKNVFSPCDNDEDCDHLKNATCIKNMCTCGVSRFCEEKNVRIVTKLGENCNENYQCNIKNSECQPNEKKCSCLNGYVATPNGKNCLLVSSGIDGSCEDSVQCYTKITYSGCQDNKCVCQQHMHAYNGSCYKNTDLGGECSDDNECSLVKFSQCKNSVCTCKEGHVKSSNGSCLPISDGEKSPCTDHTQCKATLGGASECYDGLCRCKELYQLKKSTNKCIRDMLLGDTCMKHSDCHGPYSGKRRLECVLGVCKCKSFYKEIEGYCISSTSHPVLSLILFVYGSIITMFLT